LPRPAPEADPAAFPRKLSVTEVETLVRDPYSIFAKHILKLDPLDAIAVAPAAAERGTLIHDILGTFAAKHPDALPERAYDILIGYGREAFSDLAQAHPALSRGMVGALRTPGRRLRRMGGGAPCGPAGDLVRNSGELTFPLPDGTRFTLRARADRIESRRDGGFAILDFKTGQPPGTKEVLPVSRRSSRSKP
jgi:ATP-dependent helicase/nuclease subunit B